MAISEDALAKLKILQKNMADRGQEVSMDELIRAHERGISGEKAQLLDDLLQEAKGRVQSEIDDGKESSLLEPDE